MPFLPTDPTDPTDCPPTYRATVYAVIERHPDWITARQIAELAELSYRQTLDAILYLYNEERIARRGRKFTAKWGRLSLLDPPDTAFMSLDSAIRGFFAPIGVTKTDQEDCD